MGHALNVSGDLSSSAKGTKYVYTRFLGVPIPSLLPLPLSAFLCTVSTMAALGPG